MLALGSEVLGFWPRDVPDDPVPRARERVGRGSRRRSSDRSSRRRRLRRSHRRRSRCLSRRSRRSRRRSETRISGPRPESGSTLDPRRAHRDTTGMIVLAIGMIVIATSMIGIDLVA